MAGRRPAFAMSAMIETVVFHLLAAVAVVFGVLVISLRNPVDCGMSLMVTLLSLAGLFLLLRADFVALMQVLVYGGAIMVIFLFIVMLLNLSQADLAGARAGMSKAMATLLCGGVLLVLWAALRAGVVAPGRPDLRAGFGGTASIGDLLLREYLLPFEVTSLLLLVGIVGVVLLSTRRRSGEGGGK